MTNRIVTRLLRLRFAHACLAGLLAFVTPLAQAERVDRDKPTVIDSDKLNHDDQRQITVFTGNVVLTKGTLTLRGTAPVALAGSYQYARGGLVFNGSDVRATFTLPTPLPTVGGGRYSRSFVQ